MTKDFETQPRDTTPIPFTLDGETYTFRPPKMISLILPVLGTDLSDPSTQQAQEMMTAQMDWLEAGLDEDEATRIAARLRDPKDDFDLDDLVNIVQWLVESVSKRPTTTPSG